VVSLLLVSQRSGGFRWIGSNQPYRVSEDPLGSVIKKRRKRMAKKKHRKLLRRTRHQRRNKK
jgi:hypothetical protein